MLSVKVVGVVHSVVIDSLLDFLGGVMHVAMSLLESVRSWLCVVVRHVISRNSCRSWVVLLTVLCRVGRGVDVRDTVSGQVRAVVDMVVHAWVVGTMLVVGALVVVVAHGVASLGAVPLAVLVLLAVVIAVAALV